MVKNVWKKKIAEKFCLHFKEMYLFDGHFLWRNERDKY